jgi:hypothetical protein
MTDKRKGTDMERITVKDVRAVFARLQKRLPHLHLVLDEGSKTYGRAWRIHHVPDGQSGHHTIPGHTAGGYLGMTAREAYEALHNLLYGMDMLEASPGHRWTPGRAGLEANHDA